MGMMKVNRKKGYFSISAVAKMFTVHQQTIRLYEKEGLITPKRSEGNTRLFSEEDISKLEEIVHLTHVLGINVAGVQMILKLKKQIHKLQKEMNKAFDDAQIELDKESESSKHIIKTNAQQLMKLHQEKSITEKQQDLELIGLPNTSEIDDDGEAENWEIDYDE